MNTEMIYDFLEETKKGNREKWIEEKLKLFNNHIIDEFIEKDSLDNEIKYKNYYINNDSKIWFVGHYDIIRKEYCANDNSASIINLLTYAYHYKNVNIALLDGEEPVALGAGSRRLSSKLHFTGCDYIINFELTGVGRNIITTKFCELSDEIVDRVGAISMNLPFNDSYVFDSHCFKTECILLLPDNNGSPDYKYMGYCHTEKEKWYNSSRPQDARRPWRAKKRIRG